MQQAYHRQQTAYAYPYSPTQTTKVAYTRPAYPQEAYYEPAVTVINNMPQAPAVAESTSTNTKEDAWNHTANESRIVQRVKIVESTGRLIQSPNKAVVCPLAAKGSGGVYRALVKHKRGAGADVSSNAHKGVTVTRVEILGYRNTLPHDVGVRIEDLGCSFSHIDGASGQGYLFIIPSNVSHFQTVNETMYESNKDAYGVLASTYGGLDVDRLKREVVQMSENSPNVFVPKNSMAVKAAIDAARMIHFNGEKSNDGRTRIDPKLEFVGANELAEIEGKVSMSKEFFNGFLKSVTENVMAATKPVDLDALSVTLTNTNLGEAIGSTENTLLEGTEILQSKMQEVSVDIAISFMSRHDM